MNSEKSRLIRELIRGNEISFEEAKTLGDTSPAKEKFPFRYIVLGDEYLGGATHQIQKTASRIYLPGKDLVAKFSNYSMNLESENNLLEKANSFGCPVVKTFGMSNVYTLLEDTFKPAIILEEVIGDILEEKMRVSGTSTQLELINLWEEAKSRVQKYFSLDDATTSNAIFQDSSKKIILIDLEGWKLK